MHTNKEHTDIGSVIDRLANNKNKIKTKKIGIRFINVKIISIGNYIIMC